MNACVSHVTQPNPILPRLPQANPREPARLQLSPHHVGPSQGWRRALHGNSSDYDGVEVPPHIVKVRPKRIRHWKGGTTSNLKN
jgi:hypothetical protein